MKVKKIKNKPINEDERGKIYKFIFSKGVKEIVVVKREKSAISGNHYHKGQSKNKNPEKFIVINGSLKILLKDINTNKEQSFIAKEGDEIIIYPYINHTLEALEDNTMFIESKVEEDDYKDVFKLE